MQPTASSSSYTSQDPPPRSELWWDRLPSLKIVRPPKGPFSPSVDERCITFCSQSVTGRIHGADPWCRTLCVRRVFLHEVTRVLSHHRQQTVHTRPGKPPRVDVAEVIDTAPVHHPLPPEGQRYSGWLHALLDIPASSASASSSTSATDLPVHTEASVSEPRYWKAGWYLWWSRSRWAAQERMDLMRRTLAGQTEWQDMKDRRNAEWEHGVAYDEGRLVEDAQRLGDLGNMPPFPDVSRESILLPMPSLPSLASQLRAVLAPTGTVLACVRESVASGAQAELAQRLYDKARTDEPIKLLRVCCALIWENMGFGDDDDDGPDSPDTRKKP
ncbi:hypothetical protein C8Q78DRAFT_1063555 [Trametes maxima]|nr:hypothetical protein C8Q78DRAFT_1063555 [Trametes maxima]